MVNLLAFYSYDLSSNPAEVGLQFLFSTLVETNEKKGKEAGDFSYLILNIFFVQSVHELLFLVQVELLLLLVFVSRHLQADLKLKMKICFKRASAGCG